MLRKAIADDTGLHDMARRIKSKPSNLNWLRDTLAEKGITQRELSRKLNSNPTSINHKLNGRQTWTIEELTQIASFVSVSLPELLRSMGYKAPEGSGNEIVGAVMGASQVSTISEHIGEQFQDVVSSDEKVLIVDDPSNDMLTVVNGGAVFYVPIDIGPVVNTLARIEAPGMLVPVIGTLLENPAGGYLIQPLACKQAPIEVARVLSVCPVTRLVMPQRTKPPAQSASRGR